MRKARGELSMLKHSSPMLACRWMKNTRALFHDFHRPGHEMRLAFTKNGSLLKNNYL